MIFKKILKKLLKPKKTKVLYSGITNSHWKTINYHDFNIQIYLDKEFGLISNIIEKDGIYEKNIVDLIVNNLSGDSVFVDIGANIGQHSLIASRFCKKVYSFEPIKILQNKIQQNIEKNVIQNIEVIPFGLSNENLKTEMLVMMNHIGKSKPKYKNDHEYSYLKDHWDKKNGNELLLEEIELKKLDDFSFERIDLIKMDIEGYEFFALEGGINTIMKHKPKIILEYSPSFYESMEEGMSKKLYSLLTENLNYEIQIVEEQKNKHTDLKICPGSSATCF